GTSGAAGQGGDAATPQATPKLASDYAALPLPFELNAGQADPAVRYLSRSPGFALFLTDQGATLALARPDDHATRDLLTLRFEGAAAAPQIVASGELPSRSNYFEGADPSKWITDVPHYAQVAYQGLLPGIDVRFYGTPARQLEYDLVAAPGVDP